MVDIPIASFTRAIVDLLTEIGIDPPNPRGTWIVSNKTGAGMLGSIDLIDAATASRVPGGCVNSIAGHVGHMIFALDLFTRAARGEDVYSNAKWSESWNTRIVNEAEWKQLRARLRDLVNDAVAIVRSTASLESQDLITGGVALPAHMAYHLGAIKQLASISG